MRGSRTRREVLRAVVCAALAACGAETHDAHPPPVPSASTTLPSSSVATPPAPPPLPAMPSLEALASRQVRVAPGMHEVARGENAAGVVLPPASRDECVRVAFAAQPAVTLALVDKQGAVLAESRTTTDGLLDGRGPVCFHPESQPSLRASTDAGVRYVVWASP